MRRPLGSSSSSCSEEEQFRSVLQNSRLKRNHLQTVTTNASAFPQSGPSQDAAHSFDNSDNPAISDRDVPAHVRNVPLASLNSTMKRPLASSGDSESDWEEFQKNLQKIGMTAPKATRKVSSERKEVSSKTAKASRIVQNDFSHSDTSDGDEELINLAGPLPQGSLNVTQSSNANPTARLSQLDCGVAAAQFTVPPLRKPLDSFSAISTKEKQSTPIRGLIARPGKGTGMLSNLHVSEENRIKKGDQFNELTTSDHIFIQGGDGTDKLLSSFEEAKLPQILLENLKEMGITTPTAIQRATLPLIMHKYEYDIVAQAETGSGKTAAYLLPIISLIHSMKRTSVKNTSMRPYAVIVVPTRELASQIGAEAKKLVKNLSVTVAVTYGQMDWRMSVRDLKTGCDIVIGTPGRLLCHFSSNPSGKPTLDLKSNHNWTVIDEADDFNRIGRTEFDDLMDILKKTQTRLYVFSATFNNESVVKFKEYMKSKPFEIFGREGTSTIDFAWRHVTSETKSSQLIHDIRFAVEVQEHVPKTVIFADTKARCKFVTFHLASHGLNSLLIFGECSQDVRENQLRNFASGECKILVCTNLAARGLNMRDIRYVINYDFPSNCVDVFTHRVGRTGRAGNRGCAVTYFEQGRDNASAKEIVNIMRRMDQTPPEFICNYARMMNPSDRQTHSERPTIAQNVTRPMLPDESEQYHMLNAYESSDSDY